MQKVDFTNMTFLSGGSLLVKRGSGIHSVAGLVDETVAVIPGTTTEQGPARGAGQELRERQGGAGQGPSSKGIAALESGKVSAYASDRVILVGLLVESGPAREVRPGRRAVLLRALRLHGPAQRRGLPARRQSHAGGPVPQRATC